MIGFFMRNINMKSLYCLEKNCKQKESESSFYWRWIPAIGPTVNYLVNLVLCLSFLFYKLVEPVCSVLFSHYGQEACELDMRENEIFSFFSSLSWSGLNFSPTHNSFVMLKHYDSRCAFTVYTSLSLFVLYFNSITVVILVSVSHSLLLSRHRCAIIE